MAKAKTKGTEQASEGLKNSGTVQLVNTPTPSATQSQKGSQRRTSSSGKGARSGVGGTAAPGAKSTLPKVVAETSNPQKQQYDSYNRDMRRRMNRMGQGEEQEDRGKVVRTQRQKRMERLKERRQQQLAQIKKSLPGGKIDTNPRRVYYMIAAVALIVIIVIAIFAVLRFNGILH
jgi:hypothetical protein